MAQRKDKIRSQVVCSPTAGGYSLIEMAIAMLIVGLLIAPAADIYSNYLNFQKRQTTVQNVQSLLTAISSYRTANGVFPCPSALSVPRSSANYGMQVDCTSTGGYAATMPPYCLNGVCIEKTQRASLLANPNPYYQRVIVGGVPFKQLQIPETKAYDGYGYRLVYALTESMGDINFMSNLNGGISIQDPAGKSLIKPTDSAVFAVYSVGHDGVGGYTFEGSVHIPCAGAVGADVTNCNPGFEGGAATPTAILVDGYLSNATGATHYDDYMMYFQSQPDPLWHVIPGTTNIQDLSNKSVGIPGAPTDPKVQLEVAAATGAPALSDGSSNTDALLVYGLSGTGTDGKILSDSICDSNGTNCFNPEQIGGQQADPNRIGCTTAGTYMAGIDNAQAGTHGADCAPVAMTCAGGKVMDGVVNGMPNCVDVTKDCPQDLNHPICSGAAATTVSLPPTNFGGTTAQFTVNTAMGGCRHVQWTCNNTDGTWNANPDIDDDPSGGKCSLVVTTTCDCSQLGSGYAAGACPGSLNNCGDTRDYSACGCKSPDVTNPPCPAPFTGGTEQVTVNYGAPNCTAQTPIVDTTNCQCSLPNPQVSPIACPSNTNSGSATRSCPLDTTTCTYQTGAACTDDYSLCVCVPPSPTTRTIPAACPAGGTGTQDQTFDTTSCTWVDNGPIQGCVCPADYTESLDCPVPPYANTGAKETRQHTFAAPPACTESIGSWDVSACSCPADYDEPAACTSPFGSGTMTRHHTIGAMPTCTDSPGSWDTTNCNCPADYTEKQACPSPFTGGQESRQHTFGPKPTCTETIDPTWNTSGCACGKAPTNDVITGCGPGYNSGNKTQHQVLDTTTCTYVDSGPLVDTCTCVAPTPNTQTVSCGSCASEPGGAWTGTRVCDETFDATPGVCTWGAPTNPHGCTCDTTPQACTAPHNCANPPTSYGTDCYYPSKDDDGTIQNTFTAPNTCSPGTCVATTPLTGVCSPITTFRLVNPQSGFNPGTPKPVNGPFVGDPCGCNEHRLTEANP
ncbi:MAG TPA: hypothetical protein VL625_06110, partial [Patescibacteria group bacterium]|nr:hypothetical protein [Patescibacteria group bacterium]